MKIKVSDIVINEGRRSVDRDTVIKLVDSIEQVGLINPITVDIDNVLVAGLHRLEAHKVRGEEYIEANITDKDDIIKQLIEIDENLIRNEIHFIDEGDLLLTRKEIYLLLHPETGNGGDRVSDETRTTNCRSAIDETKTANCRLSSDEIKTAICRFDIEGETESRNPALTHTPSFTDDTAEKIGMNKRTVERSVKRSEKIIPAVKQLIKEKDMTRSQADDITRMSEEQQNIIVETAKTKDVGKVDVAKIIKDIKRAKYRKSEDERKDVGNITVDRSFLTTYNCDILDAPIENNSLDVIITDPPYPKEFLGCWDKLAQFAASKLKDGGVLVAMSGQSYLPEVYRRMTIEGLNYYWTCCILTPGVSPNLRQKRLQTNWKPLLFYVKGKYTKTHLKTDIYNSEYKDTSQGQKFHKWGQSAVLMNNIITDFTYTKETICDPFAGGGTTLLAGLELKRRVIGIEADESVYQTMVKRLEDKII